MGDLEILGMPISLGTMIYQAILFTALIYILKSKFLGKVVNAMENRRETIENQLNQAGTYKKEAEELLLSQRKDTEKAKHDAKEIIALAREEANQIVKAARKDAFMIRTDAFEERRVKKNRDAS